MLFHVLVVLLRHWFVSLRKVFDMSWEKINIKLKSYNFPLSSKSLHAVRNVSTFKASHDIMLKKNGSVPFYMGMFWIMPYFSIYYLVIKTLKLTFEWTTVLVVEIKRRPKCLVLWKARSNKNISDITMSRPLLLLLDVLNLDNLCSGKMTTIHN